MATSLKLVVEATRYGKNQFGVAFHKYFLHNPLRLEMEFFLEQNPLMGRGQQCCPALR